MEEGAVCGSCGSRIGPAGCCATRRKQQDEEEEGLRRRVAELEAKLRLAAAALEETVRASKDPDDPMLPSALEFSADALKLIRAEVEDDADLILMEDQILYQIRDRGITFAEADGTERRVVYDYGAPDVGIPSGWVIAEGDTYFEELQTRADDAVARAVRAENALRRLVGAVRKAHVDGEVCGALRAAEEVLRGGDGTHTTVGRFIADEAEERG